MLLYNGRCYFLGLFDVELQAQSGDKSLADVCDSSGLALPACVTSPWLDHMTRPGAEVVAASDRLGLRDARA